IKLRQRINTTFIYVTHDQTEAMTLGDRIVIMQDGNIMQVGTPSEVFNKPQNLFVAGFIGMPQMNFAQGKLRKDERGYTLSVCGTVIGLTDWQKEALEARKTEPGTVTVGIRPEHLKLAGTGIPVKSDVCELTGSTMNLHTRTADGTELVALVQVREELEAPKPGTEFFLQPEESRLHLFDSETGQSLFYSPLPAPEEPKEEEKK
ncbi:MAG: ABC transporter ATP-binding protein, partial [Oscillospiraceae bacterium]|nr:ABC transporter ATP-binding protein [Oscillospiraceae bacterium]